MNEERETFQVSKNDVRQHRGLECGYAAERRGADGDWAIAGLAEPVFGEIVLGNESTTSLD